VGKASGFARSSKDSNSFRKDPDDIIDV
jgi:hypothetical protein